MIGSKIDAMAGLGRHDVHVAETALAEAPKTLQAAPITIDPDQFEWR